MHLTATWHACSNSTDMNEADIRNIQAPALVVIGDADIVRPEHAVERFRLMPDARLMVLPGGHGEYLGEMTTLKQKGCGHYPAVELIEAFLTPNP